MTISVGTPTVDTDNGVSSVTFSHTTVAGKGHHLLVGVSFNNDNFETITGITFNGVALSLVVAHDRDDDSRCELWRLKDPFVGTANVVVTLSATLTATAGIVSGAFDVYEVDSVTPVGSTATNDGDSVLNTVTVPSNTGELVFDVAGCENEPVPWTAGAGQTVLWNTDAGTDPKLEGAGASYKAGASPNVAMEWTHPTDKWVSIGASVRPSVAPIVDAGGPYSGNVNTAISLNATVTPGTDLSPTFLWTIDSGPGSGVFTPSATVEDPSFTPDTVGAYTLRLTVSTEDAPDVFDTASLDSQAASVPPTVDAGGPYAGPSGSPTPLNATVTPGSDPTPALLWTIDSGGTGTFLPSATVEDPTFTPTFPTVGPYTLRLTVTPSDTAPVFDTASFDSQAVAPVVDAGGPYSGTVDTLIPLDATVTPGTDPAPTLLWTIDSGPGTGVFSDPAIEDPTFTPDLTGTYTLRLTATPSDGPAVFDTSSLESEGFVPVAPQNLVGIKTDRIGRPICAFLGINDPLPAGAVILAGDALAFDGTLLVALDDGLAPRTMVNGLPHTMDGKRIVTENPGDTVLNGWRLQSEPLAQCINDGPPPATPFYNKGFAIDGDALLFVVDGGPAPTPTDPVLILTLGGTGNDFSDSNAVDSSGNWLTGSTENSQGAGLNDIHIAKYDNAGTLLWQRAIGSSSNDSVGGLTADASDNVIVTGITFTPSPNFNDAFIAKFNSAGTLQWQRVLQTSGTQNYIDCVTDAAGNIYATGRDLTFDGALAVKYNSAGALQFQRQLNGTNQTTGQGIALDSTGANFVIVGDYTVGGTQGCFIAKYNSSGVLQWERTLSGAGNEELVGVAIDSSDNIYVVGETTSVDTSDDCLIAKYNSAGVLQWQRAIGAPSPTTNGGRNIALDAAGNVYVNFAVLGSSGAAFAKYDPAGNLQWQTAFGGSGVSAGDRGSMFHDGAGNIVWSGATSLAGAGSNDIMTVRLPDDGSGLGTYGPINYVAGTFVEKVAALTDAAGTAVDNLSTLNDAAASNTVTITTLTPGTIP